MATWIAHLRIAENLLRTFPELDRCAFSIGNVAPDSGIPNEDWTVFTPPTSVTHFMENGECKDLTFLHEYLHPLRKDHFGEIETSFRVGYFCHLVADNLWRFLIGRPTKANHPEKFDADPNFIWTVKDDWYALDFVYVRSHPDSLYWTDFLNCKCPPITIPFLLEEGVRQRVDYIKTYYLREDDEIEDLLQQPRVYLHEAEINEYVDRSSRALEIILDSALASGFMLPETANSLLSLVPLNLKAPLF